jgi:hypothetical protein
MQWERKNDQADKARLRVKKPSRNPSPKRLWQVPKDYRDKICFQVFLIS